MEQLPERIVLIGFPCSGKSSLGPKLADYLNYKWLDTDAAIEAESGLSIADIFALYGEAGFRERESKWVSSQLPDLKQVVVSSGGGLPCFNHLMAKLNAEAYTIYLQAEFEPLYQRLLSRPNHTLLKLPLDSLETLFNQRILIYQGAHFSLDASPSLEHVLENLQRHFRLKI